MNNNYRIYNALSKVVMLGALRAMFLIGTGISFTIVASLFAVQTLAKLVFAMPIGILADRYNRKVVLMFGMIAKIVGYSLLLLTPNLFFLVLAFLLIGLESACSESAEDAFVHDYGTLNHADFMELRGKLKKEQVFSNIIFNFIFAYFYSVNIFLPIYWVIIISSLAFFPLLFMTEKRVVIDNNSIIDILKKGLPTIYQNQQLLYSFVYGVIFLVVILLAISLKFPVMEARGISGSMVAYIDTSLQFVAFVGLTYIKSFQHYCHDHIKEVSSLILVFGLLTAGLFYYFGLIILLITPLLFTVVKIDIAKKIADSSIIEAKTTVLATKEFVISLLVMILLPLIGYITDTFSVFFANLFLALCLLIALLVIKIRFRKTVFKNQLQNCY